MKIINKIFYITLSDLQNDNIFFLALLVEKSIYKLIIIYLKIFFPETLKSRELISERS